MSAADSTSTGTLSGSETGGGAIVGDDKLGKCCSINAVSKFPETN